MGVFIVSKKLLLVMNPCAGIKKSNRYLTQILKIFAVNEYECTVQLTTEKLRSDDIVKKYGKGKDLIVCIGGDGTFNETVAGMLNAGITAPIGYIPSGSTNDFASSLSLKSHPVRAAEDIAYGSPQSLDVGLFNGRPFTYVASFGAFTKTSYTAPRDLKNTFGHLAYILEGVKEITDIKPVKIELEAEGKKLDGNYLFGAVCNSTRVGGGLIKLSNSLVDLNDGVFEVVLIKMPVNPAEFMQLMLDLQSCNYTGPMFELFSAKDITVRADASMDWTLDGEYEKGSENIEIKNLHSAITLVIKKNAPELE